VDITRSPHRLVHLQGLVRVVDQQDVYILGSLLVAQETSEEIDLLDGHGQVAMFHPVHDAHELLVEPAPALAQEEQALLPGHRSMIERTRKM
jgi:hypothetical protein